MWSSYVAGLPVWRLWICPCPSAVRPCLMMTEKRGQLRANRSTARSAFLITSACLDFLVCWQFFLSFPSLPCPSLSFPSLPFPSLPSLPFPSLPFPSLPFLSFPSCLTKTARLRQIKAAGTRPCEPPKARDQGHATCMSCHSRHAFHLHSHSCSSSSHVIAIRALPSSI